MASMTLEQFMSMVSLKDTRYAFFVGAGASIKAGIPLATIDLDELPSVVTVAKQHIFTASNPNIPPSRQKVDQWFADKGFLSQSRNVYSDVLELLNPLPQGRKQFLNKFFVDKVPTRTHLYLAQMLRHNVFNLVLTTNFDDLLERQLYALKTDFVRYSVGESFDDFKLLDRTPKILKFHGDYHYSSIMNTDNETQSLETAKLNTFRSILKEYGLIFLGYSGNDESIMEPLYEAAVSKDCLPYGIVWIKHPNYALSNNCQKLLKLAPNKVFVLESFDLESILETTYHSAVSLIDRVSDSDDFTEIQNDNLLKIEYIPKDLERITSFIDRDAEISQLMKAINKPVIIIQGVAGSGKTYLAIKLDSELVRRGEITYWHTFSSKGDKNYYQIFYELASFFSLKLDDQQLISFLGSSAINENNEEYVIRIVLTTLKQRRCILLFDDYHYVKDKKIKSFINRLCLSINNSTIVLITRTEPDVVCYKKSHDLCQTQVEGFTPDVVKQYFNEKEVALTIDQANIIHQHSSGIPFCLELIHSYMVTHKADVRQMEKFISQMKININEQLISHVYSSLSSVERKVLRVMSVWRQSVSPEELSEILGKTQVRTINILETLMRKFLVKCDGARYSVHDLLRDFCYKRNRHLTRLHTEIAMLYLTNDDKPQFLLEALHHYIMAEHSKEVAAIVEINYDQIIRYGSLATLLDIIEDIKPTKVTKATWLKLQLIKVRICENLGEYAIGMSILMGIKPDDLNTIETQIQYNYNLGRMEYFLGNIETAKKCYLKAISAITNTEPDSFNTDRNEISSEVICSQIARILYIQGYLPAAQAVYEHILVESMKKGDPISINKAIHRLAMIISDQGDYTQAEALFTKVVHKCEQLNDQKRLSYAKVRLGNIAYYKGDLNRAKKLHQESKQIKERMGHKRGMIFSNRALARISAEEKDFEQALNLVNSSIAVASDLQEIKELNKSFLLKATLLIDLGRNDEAMSLLETALEAFSRMHLLKQKKNTHKILSELATLPKEARSKHRTEYDKLEKQLLSVRANNDVLKEYLPIIKFPYIPSSLN